MKSDDELRKDVLAELAWDAAIDANAVGVTVRDGVVTLTGHIGSYAEKTAASAAAWRVHGVKAVAVELDVQLSPGHRRSDTEIALAASDILRWHSMVPADRVSVTVEKGWITLTGEVDREYQRHSAEKALHNLLGVVGISNDIVLKTSASEESLAQRIGEALARQAGREAKHIQIEVQDGVVRLQGKVHSWYEREAAQGAIWSAPGVRSVINEIYIG